MQTSLYAPKRPALRYYGGKWRLAAWIISFFPEHQNYVEPCGGAASVLLQKPRSPLETYNGLDGNVVNFFQVLRDRPDELIQKIQLTPWSRDEYGLSKGESENSVERARMFFVSINQARAGEGSGWRFTKTSVSGDGDTRWARTAKQIYDNCHNLQVIARRLLEVQIENRDAREIITDFDNDHSLIYFDPPYLSTTRVSVKDYKLEVDRQFHIECAKLLNACKGYVIISGYACSLYTELYEACGWRRHDKKTRGHNNSSRIESVWLSPLTATSLDTPQQGTLWD